MNEWKWQSSRRGREEGGGSDDISTESLLDQSPLSHPCCCLRLFTPLPCCYASSSSIMIRGLHWWSFSSLISSNSTHIFSIFTFDFFWHCLCLLTVRYINMAQVTMSANSHETNVPTVCNQIRWAVKIFWLINGFVVISICHVFIKVLYL